MFKLDDGNYGYKKGFVLSVTSWENDYDAFNTKTKHFDTIEDAKLFISVVSKFEEQYGNECDAEPLDVDKYTKEELDYVLKYCKIDDTDDLDQNDYFDAINELKYDILGSTDNYVCRVLDEYMIFEIEENIEFKLVDAG